MARESLEELEQVSVSELLDLLQQENAQLRMDLMVHKAVIAKLRNYISENVATGETFSSQTYSAMDA